MKFICLFFIVMFSAPLFAQHEHGDVEHITSMAHGAMMPSAILLTVPMEQDGSGTSWLPTSSPVHAVHYLWRGWNLMLHGSLWLRFNSQDMLEDGERNEDQSDAPNWLMLMAQRRFGASNQFTLRTMFSLDRLTIGGDGYPLLFQTGETWNDVPLIDRQHPHDLFMELAAAYSLAFGVNTGLFLYFGIPGEPALGPPAFMHRPSSLTNPDAPLGHHWQDATHITFGTATLGIHYAGVKIEGSIFNGREPDENRYNIEKPRFDSYCGRLSFNPTKELALQVSHGLLKSPEALESDIDVWRTTASLIYHHQIKPRINWHTALIWGMNNSDEQDPQHSVLLESELQLYRNAIYTKLEVVQKAGEELAIVGFEDNIFYTNALTLGAARNVLNIKSLAFHAGAHITVYYIEDELKSFYGKYPFSFEIFLRLCPGQLQTKN